MRWRAASADQGSPQGEGEEAGQAARQPHIPDDVPRVHRALDAVGEFRDTGGGGGFGGGTG